MNSCFNGFIIDEECRHKQDACNDYFYCRFTWISEATEMWEARLWMCPFPKWETNSNVNTQHTVRRGIYNMEHVWAKWMYFGMSVCRHQERRRGLWEGKIATLRVEQKNRQNMWYGSGRDDIKVQRTWVEYGIGRMGKAETKGGWTELGVMRMSEGLYFFFCTVIEVQKRIQIVSCNEHMNQ